MSRTLRLLRTHWLLVSFLAFGALLRLGMLIALPLPLMTFTDANVYVAAAQQFLFRPVEGRTAGYPLVLRILHDVWATPTLPVVLQHVLVLAASVALYAAARVAGVSRTLAALGVGIWLVSIDWIWLEHQLLTETIGVVLVVAAVALLVLVPVRGRSAWPVAIGAGVAAGVMALGAGIVRPAVFPALPGIVLAALLLLRAPVRMRLASAAALALTFGALFVGYLYVQDDHTGFGMRLVGSELDMGAYPAVAPVAQCDRFTPPPGTRSLCEGTPPDDRPTKDWYYWDPTSPGRALLAARPDLADEIKLWASRAYEVHTGDLRRDQLEALQRLFGLGGDRRPLGEQDADQVSLEIADIQPAPVVVGAIQAYYGQGDAPNRPAGTPYGVLEDLQGPTRPPGLLLLLALLLACAGAVLGLGRARRFVLVVAATGWLPVLFGTWSGGQFNWRYVLLGIPFIATAAFGALSALAARHAARRSDDGGSSVRPRDEAVPSSSPQLVS
jgi:hypothetical protein